MLCYAMLCYAMLCYAMLCYAMLCYAMLRYDILYYSILYYTLLYSTVLYCTILYYTILYCNLLHARRERTSALTSSTRTSCRRRRRSATRPGECMVSLPTNIVDFRGFDSSIILRLRGGIPSHIFPKKFESSNVSRDNASMEVGRRYPPAGPMICICMFRAQALCTRAG